jgi:hypothetical protein
MADSIILRDLGLYEYSTATGILTPFETDYWKIGGTRAQTWNLRCPSVEAARYLVVRLRSEASLPPGLRHPGSLGNHRVKYALRVAEKLEAEIEAREG